MIRLSSLELCRRAALAVAIIAGLAALAPAAEAQQTTVAARDFPLQDGNYWELQSGTDTYTISCDYEYGAMRYVTGLSRDPAGEWLSYSATAPNSLYIYNWDSGSWQPMFRFGYAVTPWSFSITNGGCEKYNAKRARTNYTVTTPAGTFRHCDKIGFTLVPSPTARCTQGPFTSITYADGVGPVAIERNGSTYLLARAQVGAKSYPQTAGGALIVGLTTDKTAYANRTNTIRCITTPCPSNEVVEKVQCSLTLTNGTGAPQQFTFSNGCQVGFEVADGSGNVVVSSMDNQMCTMALTNFTVAANATKTLTGQVELRDRTSGEPLRTGTYTVRGFLINQMSGMQVSPANASIAVTTTPAIP